MQQLPTTLLIVFTLTSILTSCQRESTQHKILFVLTSHGEKGDTGDPTGYYLSEAAHPWHVLKEAGYEIDFVSTRGGEPPVDGFDLDDSINRIFWEDESVQEKLRNTRTPVDVNPSEYVAIHFVGGHGAMWDFPNDTLLAAIAAAIYEQGGIVSAVCHGPAALVNIQLSDGTYLVQGKRIAAFTNEEETTVGLQDVVPFLLETALREREAVYIRGEQFAANVQISERLVTGQNPASAIGVGEAILQTFAALDNDLPQLENVATFGRYQPVGLAVTNENRIFVTFPMQSGGAEHDISLAEIVDGQRIPYPNEAWNDKGNPNTDERFVNLQALWASGEHLWALDAGQSFSGEQNESHIKLLKVNLKNADVEQVYHFEDLDKSASALNDVRIDETRQRAYFSDPRQAALVVLDLQSGKSLTRLKGHPSMLATDGYVLYLDGVDVVTPSGSAFRSNVNGIAFTRDNRYFYYRAINQERLYRIPAEHLANLALTDGELAQHVEDVGHAGISHGMIADAKGNVYQSNSPEYSISYVTPEGELHTLVCDERLGWPDSFGIGTDGYLYVTAAQLNRTRRYNEIDRTEYPYGLYRVKLP